MREEGQGLKALPYKTSGDGGQGLNALPHDDAADGDRPMMNVAQGLQALRL